MAIRERRKTSDEEVSEQLLRTFDKEAWIQAVNDLIGHVEAWAQEHAWPTERRMEELDEGAGLYQVPVLTVTTPAGQVALEPIARLVIGAEGRIDFYEVRSMARVMLLRKTNDKWIVRTDSGINWPNPWGAETFYQLVEGLLDPE